MERTVLWVGRPAPTDVARLSDVGLAVTLAPSLRAIAEHSDLAVVVLSDATVAELELLRHLLPAGRPVIAMAQRADAAALLRAGAYDVVASSVAIEELVLRVERALDASKQRRRAQTLAASVCALEADLSAMRHTQDQLQRQALIDGLTGLGNRRAARKWLDVWLAFFQRRGGDVSLILVDLDIIASDEKLRRVARRLRRSVRATDQVARVIADQFLLILPAADLRCAQKVGERIRINLATTASLGVASVACAPFASVAGETLTARAEMALRRAQQLGGARVEIEPTPPLKKGIAC